MKKSFMIGLGLLILGLLIIFNSLAQMFHSTFFIDTSFLGIYGSILYSVAYLFIVFGVIILLVHFKAWVEKATGTHI